MTYYHGTPALLPAGTLLSNEHPARNKGRKEGRVWATTKPTFARAYGEHVYEVTPVGPAFKGAGSDPDRDPDDFPDEWPILWAEGWTITREVTKPEMDRFSDERDARVAQEDAERAARRSASLTGVRFEVRSRGSDGAVDAFVGDERVGFLEYAADGFIEHVNVKPEWRRKGLATQMAEHMPMPGIYSPDYAPEDDGGNTPEGNAWLEHMSRTAALRIGPHTFWRVHPPGRSWADATSTQFHPHEGPDQGTREGFSCFSNPWTLWAYIMTTFGGAIARSEVVGFQGIRIGTGHDGEDLAYPITAGHLSYTPDEFYEQLLTTPLPRTPAPVASSWSALLNISRVQRYEASPQTIMVMDFVEANKQSEWEHGRRIWTAPVLASVRLHDLGSGRDESCYSNASSLADDLGGRYVEGWARNPAEGEEWANHAWVVMPDGEIVESTWMDADDTFEYVEVEDNGGATGDDRYYDIASGPKTASSKSYFHGTQADLPEGTVLVPAAERGGSNYDHLYTRPGEEWRSDWVWISTDPDDAKIWSRYGPGGTYIPDSGHVYEVVPEGEVVNGCRAQRARIVRKVSAFSKVAYADFEVDEGSIDSTRGRYSPDNVDFNLTRRSGDDGFYSREDAMRRAGMPRGQNLRTADHIHRYVRPLLPASLPLLVKVLDRPGGEARGGIARTKDTGEQVGVLMFCSDMTWEDTVLHEVAHIRHRLKIGKGGASHGFDYAGEWAELMYQQLGWRFDFGFPVAAANPDWHDVLDTQESGGIILELIQAKGNHDVRSVVAFLDVGKTVPMGELSWVVKGGQGVIDSVMVKGQYRRQGVATKMLEFARATSPVPIVHSKNLYPDGKAWSEKVSAWLPDDAFSFKVGTTPEGGYVWVKHSSQDAYDRTAAASLYWETTLSPTQVGPQGERPEGEHGVIRKVMVEPEYRRRGLATEMLRLARDAVDYPILHSNDLTPDGRGWATKVGASNSDPTMDPSFAKLRETRSIDGIDYRFSTKDGGAFSTGAFVQATQGGKPVGHINIGWQGWSPQGFVIQWVEVSEDHQRQGVASNMLSLAREHLAPYGGVRHDTALSPSGRPWSEHVGVTAGWDDPETQRRLEELAEILSTPTGKPYDPIGDLPDPHAGYGGYISQDRNGHLILDGKPVTKLYRVVDPAEWAAAQAQGALQSHEGYTRASAAADDRWRYQGAPGVRGLTLEITYDPADRWHASAEGYAATHQPIPLSRVRKVGKTAALSTEGMETLMDAIANGTPVSVVYWFEPGWAMTAKGTVVGGTDSTINLSSWPDKDIAWADIISVTPMGLAAAAALREVHKDNGRYGRRDHMTYEEAGTIPIEVVRDMPGQMGEVPHEHRNKKGEKWEEFKRDLTENGMHYGIFIVVEVGQPVTIYEGNHRRDAAVELGWDEIPVQIRYFGLAEQDGTLMERWRNTPERIKFGYTDHIRLDDEERRERERWGSKQASVPSIWRGVGIELRDDDHLAWVTALARNDGRRMADILTKAFLAKEDSNNRGAGGYTGTGFGTHWSTDRRVAERYGGVGNPNPLRYGGTSCFVPILMEATAEADAAEMDEAVLIDTGVNGYGWDRPKGSESEVTIRRGAGVRLKQMIVHVPKDHGDPLDLYDRAKGDIRYPDPRWDPNNPDHRPTVADYPWERMSLPVAGRTITARRIGPWYHASDHDLPVGTVLLPGGEDHKAHWESHGDRVYFSNDPWVAIYHYPITRFVDGAAALYEVRPNGEISDDPEAVGINGGQAHSAPSATIIRRVPVEEIEAGTVPGMGKHFVRAAVKWDGSTDTIEQVEAWLEEVIHKDYPRGAGGCMVAAQVIAKGMGWRAMDGVFFEGPSIEWAIEHEKVYTHWWNILPNGDIFDGTAGQFHPSGDVIRIVKRSDPDFKRYLSWDGDDGSWWMDLTKDQQEELDAVTQYAYPKFSKLAVSEVVEREWAFKKLHNVEGDKPQPMLQGILRRVLRGAGVDGADHARVKPSQQAGGSHIGVDLNLLADEDKPWIIPVAYLHPKMCDIVTLLHEAAHLIDLHQQGLLHKADEMDESAIHGPRFTEIFEGLLKGMYGKGLPPRDSFTVGSRTASEDYRGGHQPPKDGAPLHDLTDGDWFPDNVYAPGELRHYTHGGSYQYDRESIRAVEQAKGKPEMLVRIYRAAPEKAGGINPGDWVAVSLDYAREHGAERDTEYWDPDVEWEVGSTKGKGSWVQYDPPRDWPVFTAEVPAKYVRNGANDIIEWGYWGPPIRSVKLAKTAIHEAGFHGTWMEPYYIRFGKIPSNEISDNYVTGFPECGTSVYQMDTKGMPIDPDPMWFEDDHSGQDSYEHISRRILETRRGSLDAFVVTGTMTGIGHDGEDCIRNITVVAEWDPREPLAWQHQDDEYEMPGTHFHRAKIAARLKAMEISSWEATKPWNLTKEEAEAQRIGFLYLLGRAKSSGHMASYDTASGRIGLTAAFFDVAEDSRRAILYHEAGHALEVAAGMNAIAKAFEVANPLDILALPGADRFGYNASEITAQAYSVIWTEPQWASFPGGKLILAAAARLANTMGFPLPASARTAAAKPRLFHGTPHALPIGTILVPGGPDGTLEVGGHQGPHAYVWMADNVRDASGWGDHWTENDDGSTTGHKGHIYEVEPIGECWQPPSRPSPDYQGPIGSYGCWVAPSARIVAEVGPRGGRIKPTASAPRTAAANGGAVPASTPVRRAKVKNIDTDRLSRRREFLRVLLKDESRNLESRIDFVWRAAELHAIEGELVRRGELPPEQRMTLARLTRKESAKSFVEDHYEIERQMSEGLGVKNQEMTKDQARAFCTKVLKAPVAVIVGGIDWDAVSPGWGDPDVDLFAARSQWQQPASPGRSHPLLPRSEWSDPEGLERQPYIVFGSTSMLTPVVCIHECAHLILMRQGESYQDQRQAHGGSWRSLFASLMEEHLGVNPYASVGMAGVTVASKPDPDSIVEKVGYVTYAYNEYETYCEVTAHDGSLEVGTLWWEKDTGIIEAVETHSAYRREGIATKMLEIARRSYAKPITHSRTLTPDGKAWSEKVGVKTAAGSSAAWAEMGFASVSSDPKATYPERYNSKGLLPGMAETKLRENIGGLPTFYDVAAIPESDVKGFANILKVVETHGKAIPLSKGWDSRGWPLYEVPGSERPITHVYRVVSLEDWENIQRTKVIQSDGRMNLGAEEGTVASVIPTGEFYKAKSGPSVILKIKVNPADGWRQDHDGYIKTRKPIPLSRVERTSRFGSIRPTAQKVGDERAFGRFTMRYTTKDTGGAKPQHVITTYGDGIEVGSMVWHGRTHGVINTEVKREYRRLGIATAMWEWSQEMRPKAKHSTDRTDDGDAWARSVGGPLPRRNTAALASSPTYYHGSPHALPIGTVLVPGGPEGKSDWPGVDALKGVWMTSDLVHARMFMGLAGEMQRWNADGHLYLVEPVGEPSQLPDGRNPRNWYAPSARVVAEADPETGMRKSAVIAKRKEIWEMTPSEFASKQWVYHGTRRQDDLEKLLRDGVKISNVPMNMNRRRMQSGDLDGIFYQPGAGAGMGLYVGDFANAQQYGNRIVAIEIDHDELELGPESADYTDYWSKEKSIATALRDANGALITKDIPASRVYLVADGFTHYMRDPQEMARQYATKSAAIDQTVSEGAP